MGISMGSLSFFLFFDYSKFYSVLVKTNFSLKISRNYMIMLLRYFHIPLAYVEPSKALLEWDSICVNRIGLNLVK